MLGKNIANRKWLKFPAASSTQQRGSLKTRLDRSHSRGEQTADHAFDFETPVETGFQLATFQGPLCAEPVEGLAYFVENLEIDNEGIEEEIGIFGILSLPTPRLP